MKVLTIKPFKIVSLALCFVINASWAQQPNEATEFQPKMRVIDRDWQYFKSVPCERIDKEIFHSRSEELLLVQRKSQCINRYKAFLPKPLS
ncbi:hypothetical protein [Dasania marina]|uniref:hypothetical protein n=1 Tax=Dasania marina TaxID=471499 RepID=UPI0030D97F2E|tara:strand:+ start:14361 stop:14633 length:273 start_codon:yes stop_codon:yes gene_type:complete